MDQIGICKTQYPRILGELGMVTWPVLSWTIQSTRVELWGADNTAQLLYETKIWGRSSGT